METRSLGHLFADTCRRHAERPAFHHKVDGEFRPISYRDAEGIVRRLATELAARGIGHGDRVAILAHNRPEWAYADLALLTIGAVVVPIYPTLLPDQVEFILRNSGSKAIFLANAHQHDKIAAAGDRLPELAHAFVIDRRGCPDTVEDVQSVLAARPEADEPAVSARLEAVGPGDLASLVYTSGTTGDPKGVMLTHGNILSNALAAPPLFGLVPEDVALSFLPLSHIFERTGGYYTMIAAGASIAYAESIDTVAKNLLEVRPTVMCSVPRLYEKMYDRIQQSVKEGSFAKRFLFARGLAVGRAVSARREAGQPVGPALGALHRLFDRLVFSKVRERTGGRLRYSISGGAPLEPRIARFFHAIGLLVLEGYGQTETSPIIAANTPEAYRLGTVGKPFPDVEVRLAPEDGEILVRGPNVMKGYFGNEEATREAIGPDGWLRTGDIGEFDADGFLRITDRKKDLFKTSGGKYVAPARIENSLKLHPLVSQAIAIGERRKFVSVLIVPDFERLAAELGRPGESPEALIESPEARSRYDAVLEDLGKQLASYEAPKKFTLLPRELTLEEGELTPTQKIKRKVVEKKFAELIDAMYA